MSIPQNILSTSPFSAAFRPPRINSKAYLSDVERGGADIGDSSQGVDVQDWSGTCDGTDVVLEGETVAPVVVYTGTDISEFQFTFDAAMNVCLTLVEADIPKIWWFDGTLPGYDTVLLPAAAVNPRCSLDDKRDQSVVTGISTIIVAYIRTDNGTLCVRDSADRFLVEYVLASGYAGNRLINVGMNVLNRFQFLLR